MLSSIVYPLKTTFRHKDREQDQNGTLYMEEDRRDIWEKFYEGFSRSFWFYIFKICGNEQTADDVFQESFFKFLIFVSIFHYFFIFNNTHNTFFTAHQTNGRNANNQSTSQKVNWMFIMDNYLIILIYL